MRGLLRPSVGFAARESEARCTSTFPRLTSGARLHTATPWRPATRPTQQRRHVGVMAASSAHPNTVTPKPTAEHKLGHELLRGSLVEFSTAESLARRPPPTAVLLHGILGSRKNLTAFAKRIVDHYPTWQVLLVDLRCHGESALLSPGEPGPHSVQSSARDVLDLLRSLKIFPTMLVGHSFGGKVVMSMAAQFGQRLPRPIDVWVLDTLPGYVDVTGPDRKDHPADLIEALKDIPMPVRSRSRVVDYVMHTGFSEGVAKWMTTNLKPASRLPKTLVSKVLGRPTKAEPEVPPPSAAQGEELLWSFDLDGISEMYRSYEEEDLWDLVKTPPQGLSLHFVRAERSSWRWRKDDQEVIERHGHKVHLLRDAGHWLHTDNPEGLFQLMTQSLGPTDNRIEEAARSRSPR
ncbi:unnamed protein product [Pedinophyceae sp. YPF-701]|nr:unnamed protein product [Pedinophyceae sp. YPF-701]